MGTITDLESAKSWLRGSFFYQRVRKNPSHYAIGEDGQSLDWQQRMDNLVLASVQNLRENQLVEEKQDSATNQLASTEYGEIMSKVCLLFFTHWYPTDRSQFYIRQATVMLALFSPDWSAECFLLLSYSFIEDGTNHRRTEQRDSSRPDGGHVSKRRVRIVKSSSRITRAHRVRFLENKLRYSEKGVSVNSSTPPLHSEVRCRC
jgi:hypothetical protein